MVDLTSYAFQLINAEEVTSEAVALITTAGQIDTLEYGEILTIGVDFDGKPRQIGLNKSNARRISAKFGRETNQWIGKKLSLSSVTINAFGKKTLSIYVEPLD